MTKILRTPEEYFKNLSAYSFTPHYIDDLSDYEGMRIHYLDEGPQNARYVFLCLHGEPTWSYLYRKMIPVFIQAGGRVIAPDFLGFGRSDKPVEESIYTFNFHRNMLLRLIERLDLQNITLVCQDWGGVLGLTVPMEMPDRFSRLFVMNTALATGDKPLGEAFLAWRGWVNKNPDMNITKLMARSCPHLTPQECAAYEVPFPDMKYKAGVRRFPNIVPDHPNAMGASISRKALAWWKNEWKGQSFMAIGMQDPILGPFFMKRLHTNIRGCPPPYEAEEAGHFVQEWGEEIAQKALKVFQKG